MKTRDKWNICRRYIVALLFVTAVFAVSLTPTVQGWPWDDDNDWLPELPEFEWPEIKWPKIEMSDFKRTLRNWMDSITTSMKNVLSGVTTGIKSLMILSWLLMPFIAVALVAVSGLAGAHLLIKRRRERKKGRSGNDETERESKEREEKPVCSPGESICQAATSNFPAPAKEEHLHTEKELVGEREVLVKTRCRYCHTVYDETLDSCPYCGAAR